MWLFLAFLAVPLVEIALFIQVGGILGVWATLLIVIVTAISGGILVRHQGLATLHRVRTDFSRLEDPSEALASGAMILFAGALLLTPGFFTDAVGFALLVPGIRLWLFKQISGRIRMHAAPGGDGRAGRDTVIEGEFHEIDPTKTESGPPSGWTRH